MDIATGLTNLSVFEAHWNPEALTDKVIDYLGDHHSRLTDLDVCGNPNVSLQALTHFLLKKEAKAQEKGWKQLRKLNCKFNNYPKALLDNFESQFKLVEIKR